MRALVAELEERLHGARLQQIYHPCPTTLTLELWAGSDYTLLLALGQDPRVHLTSEEFRNPPVPSALAMVLRKYIKNGILRQVSQQGFDRIVDFAIAHDELYTLRCELLGKQSNVILLREAKILGALRPVIGQRSFRPGDQYQPPQPQAKLNPLLTTFAEFSTRFSQDTTLIKALVQIVDGIGPRLAQEIALRAQLDPALAVTQIGEEEKAMLWEAVQALFVPVGEERFQPVLYFAEKLIDVAPFPLKLYAHLRCEPRSTLSEALDECARAAAQERTETQELEALQRWLREKLAHTRAALEQIEIDLRQTQHYAALQHEGELILANLDRLQKGMTEATLDLFDNTSQMIKLDPALNPIENAQKRFERYKKLKRAEKKLCERRALFQKELQDLESIVDATELSAMRRALQAHGYRPSTSGSADASTKKKTERPGPRVFLIRGYRVLAGRSSRENDELIRQAHREDFWLHARDRAGAHIIIKNPQQREVPADVLEQAAQLAAYYSKGRDAKKVPISYTRVKYLRKSKGARPGLVLMTQEEGTLLVTPKGDF